MRLIHKTITVDQDDWDYMKSLNINCSEAIRDFLHNLRRSKENNIEGINIQLVTLKAQEQRKQIGIIQAKLELNEQLIEEYNRQEVELKKKKMEEEKERIEKETHCPECLNILTEENSRAITKEVTLCRICSLDNSKVAKYLKKQKVENNE